MITARDTIITAPFSDSEIPVGAYIQIRPDLNRAYVVSYKHACQLQQMGARFVPNYKLEPEHRALVDNFS